MKYTAQLEFFGIKLGLDQITELLARLGNPEKQLRFIHLAGTNGKGSVCAMIEAGIRASGYRTGFYSSPHLVSINERFRINGNPISDQQMAAYTERIRVHADAMTHPPSFFEFTTALAALCFAEAGCDFVLWETGMGGRLDATNVVMPILTILTRIGIDHAAHLGDTLAVIAAEKTGILKHGVPVVSGVQDPIAEQVILQRAEDLDAPMIRAPEAGGEFTLEPTGGQSFAINGERVRLSLLGVWQRENAALAYAALKYLSAQYGFDFGKSVAAWENIVWPARFQRVAGMVIDGAHNPDAAHALAESWQLMKLPKAVILFAGFADKDARTILEALHPIAERFIFTVVTGAKGRPGTSPETLQKILAEVTDIPSEGIEDIDAALTKLRAYPNEKLVTGSLYLAGAVLSVVTAGSMDKMEILGSAHQQRSGTV